MATPAWAGEGNVSKQFQGAIAVFVKTPGLSPIKTRLAHTIGSDLACEFYLKAKDAIEITVNETCSLDKSLRPYWAVAEAEAVSVPLWEKWPTIFQGDGGLGQRLSTIYSGLLDKYQYAIMIGADSPQLESSTLLQAAEVLSVAARASTRTFVVGHAHDGGFYLFGGTESIPPEAWNSIPYSNPNTGRALVENIMELGSVVELTPEFDVDTYDDLLTLRERLEMADVLNMKKDVLLKSVESTIERFQPGLRKTY